jgi:hypothetical protein
MSGATYRPSFFVWWYAYCSDDTHPSAPTTLPAWRHAFIQCGDSGLILETLVPSAHHLHKGSRSHHDAGGIAQHQEIILSSHEAGDLILGEELNSLAMQRLQCSTEHAVLIQNASVSALVEFRNANERREFVNYAAELILQSHFNLISVSKHRSPSLQNVRAASPKEGSQTFSKLHSRSSATEKCRLPDPQPELVVHETPSTSTASFDIDDLSRSTSNAHQALSKLTQQLQTVIHKSQVGDNSLTYSSGDDEDIRGWDYWGYLPPKQQNANAPSEHIESNTKGIRGVSDVRFSDWSETIDSTSKGRHSEGSAQVYARAPIEEVPYSVSHGTQTSSVYQTIMSKLLPKDLASTSHARAKCRVLKSQLERNSVTEIASDWEKTLRSHLPVPNKTTSPHSPRRFVSPLKSPRSVQFSTTTQFVSSQVSVDALLSDEGQHKKHLKIDSPPSVSPSYGSSPAQKQKGGGSYAEWFEKKRMALAMVGSMSFRDKKISSSSSMTPVHTGSQSFRSDSKSSQRDSQRIAGSDSYGSTHVHDKGLKSSGLSHEAQQRSNSAPKERKKLVVTPPRVWRIPDFNYINAEASESTPRVIKHRSSKYGNGNASNLEPHSSLKSQSLQALVKASPQFFQLNQDDFVELVSARESTLSPSLNSQQESNNRQISVSQGESNARKGGSVACGHSPALSKRRGSLFTQKKIAKLEPEITSYMASREFQSLPVRLQKTFAIGQQLKKTKASPTQPSFKP